MLQTLMSIVLSNCQKQPKAKDQILQSAAHWWNASLEMKKVKVHMDARNASAKRRKSVEWNSCLPVIPLPKKNMNLLFLSGNQWPYKLMSLRMALMLR